MTFVDAMRAYFRGEKLEAALFIAPVGIAFVALGVFAFREWGGAFGWGIAIPVGLFGLVMVATGIGIAMRTAAQVAEIERRYAEAAGAMAASELPRMWKVNRNFRVTLRTFLVLIVAGPVLYFALEVEWMRGIGAALTLIAVVGLLVDSFAARRGLPYTAALEHIAGQAGIDA